MKYPYFEHPRSDGNYTVSGTANFDGTGEVPTTGNTHFQLGVSGSGTSVRTIIGSLASIVTTPKSSVSAYAVEENLPVGLTPTNINQGGVWDIANRKIKWGLFTDSSARTFTYKVNGSDGIYTVSGTANFDGTGEVPTIGNTHFQLGVSGSGTSVRTITGNSASIVTTPKSSVSAYAVEENIPVGLTPANINQGGVWDIANRKIKWGLFTDNSARTFTYEVNGSDGIYTVSGTANFDGTGEVPTIGNTHFQLGVSGSGTSVRTITGNSASIVTTPKSSVSAYAVEENLPVGLTPTNINQGGVWDIANRKIKWGLFTDNSARTFTYKVNGSDGIYTVSGTANFDGTGEVPTTGNTHFQLGVSGSGTSVRTITGNSASIVTTPKSSVSAYAVEENLPVGLTPTNINQGGVWDIANRKIKWGLFTDNSARTFTYKVNGATGTYTVSGTANFDGTDEVTTTGDNQIVVPAPIGTVTNRTGATGNGTVSIPYDLGSTVSNDTDSCVLRLSITDANASGLSISRKSGSANFTATGLASSISKDDDDDFTITYNAQGPIDVPETATFEITGGDGLTPVTFHVKAKTIEIIYSLSVQSVNPNNSVDITVSPGSNGSTPFTRDYNSGTSVTLTAPDVIASNNFDYWVLDAASQGSDLTLVINMNENHTAKAVYKAPYKVYAYADFSGPEIETNGMTITDMSGFEYDSGCWRLSKGSNFFGRCDDSYNKLRNVVVTHYAYDSTGIQCQVDIVFNGWSNKSGGFKIADKYSPGNYSNVKTGYTTENFAMVSGFKPRFLWTHSAGNKDYLIKRIEITDYNASLCHNSIHKNYTSAVKLKRRKMVLKDWSWYYYLMLSAGWDIGLKDSKTGEVIDGPHAIYRKTNRRGWSKWIRKDKGSRIIIYKEKNVKLLYILKYNYFINAVPIFFPPNYVESKSFDDLNQEKQKNQNKHRWE